MTNEMTKTWLYRGKPKKKKKRKKEIKLLLISLYDYTIITRGCPRGVIVKAIDCEIVVREFVLQSRYYVHFRANTLGKGMNPLILPAMG